MKKNCFYLIGIVVSLCLFASCSKSKDEPEEMRKDLIPIFEIVGEKPYEWGITYRLNADGQTLSVVANSNTAELRVENLFYDVWIEYKEMKWNPEAEQIEFLFYIYPNPSGSEREGHIIIASPEGTVPYLSIVPRTITIIQAPETP